MEKQRIKPGAEYAIREPVAVGVEFQHVKILENVRGSRWRAEWIDPNPGLIEYISSKNVIVEWAQRKAFLRDEQHAAVVRDHLARSGYRGDEHPVSRAVSEVFEAAGEPDLLFWRGELEFEPDALERLAGRAGVVVPTSAVGYTDRHGRHHLPFECALSLAEHLARREPSTVLTPVEVAERDWTSRAREPGGDYALGLLADYRACWAIIRQWAGHDAAVAIREERIDELERLLTRVMWDLRHPAPDPGKVADRIERYLRRQ